MKSKAFFITFKRLSVAKIFPWENAFKEMQITWESKYKKFHVEIRVFLMTCLFDLF